MSSKKCSVIVPARNEEGTIKNCCIQLAHSKNVAEVIVVANDCNDMTAHEARNGGAKVIETTQAGKGFAITLGIKQALQKIIILCDGDLKNPSPAIIDALLQNMSSSKIKLVKGYFNRSSQPGPVTDMLIRPLLRTINHPAGQIKQPLSGMIAVDKDFICNIDLPNDYGVDLTILLAAYKKQLQVSEAALPPIEHRERPWSHYQLMATEISEVLLKFNIINKWKGI